MINKFINMKLLSYFLIILLAAFSAPAFAQVTDYCVHNPSAPQCQAQSSTATASNDANAAPPAHAGNNSVPDILSKSTTPPNTVAFFSFTQNVLNIAHSSAERFIPYAIGIASLLGAIAFVWLGIMIMLSQADVWHMGIRPLFSLIMTVGFTFWFLFDYQFLTTSVVDGFTFAGNIIAGIGGSSASGGSTIASVGKLLFDDITNMMAALSYLQQKALYSGGDFFSDAIHLIENIPNDILDGAAISVSLLVSIIIYALFVIIYLVYQIVIAVAIAVGPVFIPFLILPVTRNLFEGWVKMLIMGGIYLMTSTVIVGLVGQAMVTEVQSLNNNLSFSGDVFNYGSYLEMCVFEIVGIIALFKTHEFAHAIGGSVSIGGINPASGAAKIAKSAAGGK